MMLTDEDVAYGKWKQAEIERDWDSLTNKVDFAKFDARERGIPIHQKVGTVIPFSRTVDRDPNPRIPLSVPENSYPKFSKREAAVWFVIGAVLVAWWTGVL